MLEFWTLRKKKLDQCHQYVLFERSAKQVRETMKHSTSFVRSQEYIHSAPVSVPTSVPQKLGFGVTPVTVAPVHVTIKRVTSLGYFGVHRFL